MMHGVEAFSKGILQINAPLHLKEGDVKVITMYTENDEVPNDNFG